MCIGLLMDSNNTTVQAEFYVYIYTLLLSGIQERTSCKTQNVLRNSRSSNQATLGISLIRYSNISQHTETLKLLITYIMKVTASEA